MVNVVQTYNSQRLVLIAALGMTLCILIGGCSRVDKARQSMRRGEPVQAVQFYQMALIDDPDDDDVRAELAEARQAAGDVLADDARAALDSGRLGDAVSLATQAAQHDRTYRTLEQTARHSQAEQLLRESRTALDQSRFGIARQRAADALETAPDLAEPVTQLATIDRAEAEDLRNRLDALIAAGDFDDAARLATRAAELQQGDQVFAQLPTEVDQRRREAQFDFLAVNARRAIDDGRLGDFWPVHAELTALNVRHDALNALQHSFTEHEQRLLDTLAQAESARDSGNFQRAAGLYRTAEALATDRPGIAEQRIAAESQRIASALQRTGRAAIDDGAYDDAIDALRESLDMHAVDETDELLREAERRWHRQSYQNALQHNNLAAAVDNLTKLLRVAPDADLTESLDQLRLELAAKSLAEASALHADGKTQTAMHVLRRAMNRVHDPRLDSLHAELNAELLLRQAVAADRAQQFAESRDLYLQALAAGGDRSTIEQRISDIRVLDDMQQKQRAAEHDAEQLGAALNTTRLQLRSREQENRNLIDQINACEREIDRLGYALRDAQYEIRHEEARSRTLASEVYNLKCEIDRLKDDLRHARRRAHESHSRHSSRDVHDPRRPR